MCFFSCLSLKSKSYNTKTQLHFTFFDLFESYITFTAPLSPFAKSMFPIYK